MALGHSQIHYKQQTFGFFHRKKWCFWVLQSKQTCIATHVSYPSSCYMKAFINSLFWQNKYHFISATSSFKTFYESKQTNRGHAHHFGWVFKKILLKYSFKIIKKSCELKKCYIIILCKYMFKEYRLKYVTFRKYSQKSKFSQCWKTYVIMFNKCFWVLYFHFIHSKLYNMFPYYVNNTFCILKIDQNYFLTKKCEIQTTITFRMAPINLFAPSCK